MVSTFIDATFEEKRFRSFFSVNLFILLYRLSCFYQFFSLSLTLARSLFVSNENRLQALVKAVVMRRTQLSKIDGSPIISLPTRSDHVRRHY